MIWQADPHAGWVCGPGGLSRLWVDQWSSRPRSLSPRLLLPSSVLLLCKNLHHEPKKGPHYPPQVSCCLGKCGLTLWPPLNLSFMNFKILWATIVSSLTGGKSWFRSIEWLGKGWTTDISQRQKLNAVIQAPSQCPWPIGVVAPLLSWARSRARLHSGRRRPPEPTSHQTEAASLNFGSLGSNTDSRKGSWCLK